MVPAPHVPLRDVDRRGPGGGHGKDQGTSRVPWQEHTWDRTPAQKGPVYLKKKNTITRSLPNENTLSRRGGSLKEQFSYLGNVLFYFAFLTS